MSVPALATICIFCLFMLSFGFWNVRGCNDPLKIKEIRKCILDNNLYLFSILEMKVKAVNEQSHQRSLL